MPASQDLDHDRPTPEPRRVRRWLRLSALSHATVVAYLALFLAMSGTAVAATGGNFVLGKGNSATTVSTLTNTAGTALSLRSPAGTAPLTVNRTVKVGNLNADLLDGRDSSHFVTTATFAALQSGYTALQFDFAALEASHSELTDRVSELEELLAGVSRVNVDGHDTVRFSGLNVQIVDGTGTTSGTPNGRGNLLIGYSAQRPAHTPASRTGSHYLVIGDRHEWTGAAGIVAGTWNTSTGQLASVLGGERNLAAGHGAIVAGGLWNTASGHQASVAGGGGNSASGDRSSVSGGNGNVASGIYSSVLGGFQNTAAGNNDEPFRDGDFSTVSGGRGNIANGYVSSVSGGVDNTARGAGSSVLGGSGTTLTTNLGCHPRCS